MKLFVIIQTSSQKVVAISESSKDVQNYMLQKEFDTEEYFCSKIKKEKHINGLLVDFDDLYLEHDDELDMVLTRVELQMVRDIIGEERGRISSTLLELEHYIKDYNLKKKEKKTLLEAYEILHSARSKKRLKKVINLKQFIGYISKSKNVVNVFRDKLHDVKEKMYLFINLKE